MKKCVEIEIQDASFTILLCGEYNIYSVYCSGSCKIEINTVISPSLVASRTNRSAVSDPADCTK